MKKAILIIAMLLSFSFQSISQSVNYNKYRIETWLFDNDKLYNSKKHKYKWKKLTATEKSNLQTQRNAIIENWRSAGRSKKRIRKQLRSYRKRYNRKKRKIKSGKGRYSKKTLLTSSDRDYEKINKSMVLAKANCRWHLDTIVPKPDSLAGYIFSSKSFSLSRLFKFKKNNIAVSTYERLLENKKILISNTENYDVRLFYLDKTQMLKSKNLDGKVGFEIISFKENVVPFLIISFKKITEENYLLAYKFGDSIQINYQFQNYELYNKKTMLDKVKKLCGYYF